MSAETPRRVPWWDHQGVGANIPVRAIATTLAGGRRCREISRQQKSLEAHRHELIKELVRQKEGAIKEFDEELAKLGYDGAHGRKRSHHKAAGDKKPSE